MKKYKKIIIVVLCFALLLSMCTVSAFAYQIPNDGALDTEGYYHINEGWTVAADSGEIVADGIFIIDSTVRSFTRIVFGKSSSGDSSADSIVFYYDSVVAYNLTPDESCTFQFLNYSNESSNVSVLFEFFDSYVDFAPFNLDDYTFNFSIDENWSFSSDFGLIGDFNVVYQSENYEASSLFFLSSAFFLGSDFANPDLTIYSSDSFDISGKIIISSDFDQDQIDQVYGFIFLFFDFGFRNGTVETLKIPPPASKVFFNNFFTSIGSGLRSFLPSLAGAGVDAVDIMFINTDGSFTVIAVLAAIGFVLWAGRKIFNFIKNKSKV